MINQYAKARQVAIDYIRRYVERGDTYESLRHGGMGCFVRGGLAAKIGSAPIPGIPQARFGADTLRVLQIDGVECLYEFHLRSLFDEIKSGSRQLVLELPA